MRQQRELTFTLPNDSASLCTATNGPNAVIHEPPQTACMNLTALGVFKAKAGTVEIAL